MVTLMYLLGISIIMLIYSMVWKYVFMLPITLIMMVLKLDQFKLSFTALQIIGYYILSSLLILYTLGYTESYDLQGKFTLFTVLTGILLFVSAINEIGGKSTDAERSGDYFTLEAMPFIITGVFIGLGVYILAAFQPEIALNPISVFVLKIIRYITQYDIINWILSIVGSLYLLSMMFYSAIYSLSILALGTSKIFGKSV
ncbi:hypothetical protein DRW41_22005 [Neobacillus piezotolerans]|uniref:Uncharacterized protein n=1 Tax=Neobacillus piezotolerans TaxID=2259171 RepID=A0A3D8GK46_9BACI|nr:hypothetical protein [Neobacillus piezotolerans]RDU34701.1 hypothetical protein DRW41_22005 [Neobacillus piezotolerans]